MQLAHTGNDGLTRLFVGVGLKRRVLLGQLHQGDAHLLLTGLGLRLDGHADNGLGEFHGLEDDRMLLIAERVAGRGVLHTDRGGDIAGIDRVDILAVIGVHLQDAAQTLAGALRGVQNGRALVEAAGINAEEAQLADIRVGRDLEGQSGERCVVVRRAEVLFVSLRVHTGDALLVEGRRHEVDDGVEQFLNALVLIGGAAGHGHHLHGDGRLADGSADHVLGHFLAAEVELHDGVILIGDGIEQLLVVFLRKLGQVLGDLLLADILAQLIVEDIGLHADQVDHAAEIGLRTNGELNGDGVTLQPFMHHVENIVEIRAHDVHLIDIHHARDMILVGLTPDGLRLGLHAALCAQHRHSTVEHAQGTLDLNREVNVARGVDDVDAAVTPEAGRCSGRDGDAALLLLLHPVHGSRALVGLTDLVGAAGVEQDTLGRGGFAGVDVRHDTNISCILKRVFSRHWVTPLICLPAEMGECLVRFCHLVGIFALLHRGAGVVAGVHDLAGEALFHGLLAALAGISSQPAQAERLTALRANLQRNLIGCAAHAAGLDFQGRHDVFHCLLESVQTVLAGLGLDDLECVIDDALGNALLAVEHDAVDELSHQSGIIDRIRKDLSLGNITSSGHFASLLHKKMIS